MDSKNLALAISLRHELHRCPELSNHEAATKNRLIAFFQEHTGFKIFDQGKWFYAAYTADAKAENIAFRAEMDALPIQESNDKPYASVVPGVSHMCGHDGQCATLAALALEIDTMKPDKNVFFLFQHAEEVGDGARECAAFIQEQGIQEIYAYHNMPEFEDNLVYLRRGTMNCASKGMIIQMTGTVAHASMPEKGVSPAEAIAKIILSIPSWINPDTHKGLILCTVIRIDAGEESFGTAAGSGRLLLTLRAQYENELDELQNNLETFSLSAAEKYGLTCTFQYKDEYPETANHSESVDKIVAACEVLGFKTVEMAEPHRGSEDFGHLLKQTKGAVYSFGTGSGAALHTSNYDFPDRIIEPNVEIMKTLLSA